MIIFRKARTPAQTLNDLEAYISGLGDEPIEFLAREVRRWGEFSYSELEAAIEAGHLDELIAWRERYARVVNEVLAPMWASAFLFAAQRASRGKTILSDSDPDVRNWLKNHGGELITRLTDESRRAIANVILHAQERLMNPKEIARQIRPLIGLNAQQAQANFNYRLKVYNRYLQGGSSVEVATSRADKAALRYASKQHRFRAETVTHTELAFAYNQGAHVGVQRAISRGLMSRCAMVWTTAGTNRVCPRCLPLKDKVVGYTDEAGVQIPPLHPRCRCAIDYREVVDTAGTGGNVGGNKPQAKPTIDEAAIRAKLEETKTELKIKGELIYPPPKMDLSGFVFDAAHTQGDKHPHDVTETEARKFITDAYFAIHFKGNNSMNYFGRNGAAYVQLGKKKIRTAFKAAEYNPKFKKMIEVYENAQRES